MKFCKTYHEEFGLFRLSDLGKSSPLPIYNKKKVYYYRLDEVRSAEEQFRRKQVDRAFQEHARSEVRAEGYRRRAEGRALERKRQLAIARGLYKKGVALSVLASSFNYTEKQIAG